MTDKDVEHWKKIAADFAKQVEENDRQREFFERQVEVNQVALERELKATKEARDDLAKRVVELVKERDELRDLTRYAEENKRAREYEATRPIRDALDEARRELDRLHGRYEAAKEIAERGTNAIRVKELETELDRMKREHSEEVARLEGDLRRVVSKRDFHYSQSEAFREIALAAVGVKP